MPDPKQSRDTADNVSVLSNVPNDMSLMGKAIALQSKAAEYGFDWPTIEPVFDKLQEEIQELKHELEQAKLAEHSEAVQSNNRLQDELGDVLFCCMNLARFMNVDPSAALQSTNSKFERRFSFIENSVAERGKKMKDLSLEELDSIWEQAKENGL